MSEKIATCKPSLISNRANFNYKFSFIDSTNAEWVFDLHTMTAKQRGAIAASVAVVKLNEGKVETELESNAELIHTATIYNALDAWNLPDAITVDNIDLLPKDVRNALVMAINAHEAGNDASLEAEIKN